ncbi:GGDEF domain-containing protein [Caldimonas brevitalea]|uniref:diguanylate cyclase n=1 Tax=Caldimonas brevitalea TaxID=413882 RepID=A0A0G3BDB7_9BURK|nr:GGDEF domain-containing protein [Caldimonas brevitalea]AKJ27379.1 diguanylate cyclase/phosphodiesterase [Caldimonas brevitalea]
MTPTDPDHDKARAERGWERAAAVIFTRDRKRRIRLVQTCIGTLVTVLVVLCMLLAAVAGYVSWGAVVGWTVAAGGGTTTFFVAVRTGWSERYADPALTLVQMVYAVACCAAAYAIVGPLRGAVFPLVMVVMMFGMFALPPRQVTAVSLYSVLLFGVTMAVMAERFPATFDPQVELAHFLLIATMMPAVAALAAQLSRLRTRLRNQRHDLAQALQRIQFLATRDELTGLVNRRHMSELLEREQRRNARHGAAFCIGLIDLDHFKQINDTHGHAAGDEALKRFAAVASTQIRTTDTLARWGGEEFVLLMPDSALPRACLGPERLRRAFADALIRVGAAQFRVTLSCGVVQHRPEESVADLVGRADAALYAAKQQGRNRVVAR